MISVAEARARILEPFTLQGIEWLTLNEALHRILARDLQALRTQPPNAVSAMDGYAVRAGDTVAGNSLEYVGEVRAGTFFERPLRRGETVRIFTGAALPDGADAILIQENAKREGDRIHFDGAVEQGRYVRPAGLDFEKGWTGLRANAQLGPQALGLAATMGHVWLPVLQKPRIGLLATGDELCMPGASPPPHQHVSSNTTALAAMCRKWGAEPVDLGIAQDRAESLREAASSIDGLDLLVTTGGASVGDYDLVRSVLAEEGLEIEFWRIAMRPGKPLMFGAIGTTPVLGLPGNPVSASVCGLMFLRPAIAKMLGQPTEVPLKNVHLLNALEANDEREDYLRATLEKRSDGDWVRSAAKQDSSMFATFALADALLVRPPFDARKEVGDIIAMVELNRLL